MPNSLTFDIDITDRSVFQYVDANEIDIDISNFSSDRSNRGDNHDFTDAEALRKTYAAAGDSKAAKKKFGTKRKIASGLQEQSTSKAFKAPERLASVSAPAHEDDDTLLEEADDGDEGMNSASSTVTRGKIWQVPYQLINMTIRVVSGHTSRK